MNEIQQKNSGRYSPELTAQIRKAKVADVLTAQTNLMEKNKEKTDLRDLPAVERVVENYVSVCKEIGFIPNIESLCAQLGIGRSWFYKFCKEHPENETAQYLSRVRLAWAGARVSLAEAGAIDNPMAIFYLKNSGLNFSDKHELEIDVEEKSDRPEYARNWSDERWAEEIHTFTTMIAEGDEAFEKYQAEHGEV